MANNRINFYYDPQRQGYDTTLWKTLSGVPAMSGNNINFNAASAIGYADIFKANLILRLTIPTVPTVGDDRRFGFAQLNLGAHLGFRFNGTTFQVEAIDGKGNTETQDITWDASWTATPVTFEIDWTGFSATFKINGERMAFFNGVSIPKDALSEYISNVNADNLTFHYLEVETVQYYI